MEYYNLLVEDLKRFDNIPNSFHRIIAYLDYEISLDWDTSFLDVNIDITEEEYIYVKNIVDNLVITPLQYCEGLVFNGDYLLFDAETLEKTLLADVNEYIKAAPYNVREILNDLFNYNVRGLDDVFQKEIKVEENDTLYYYSTSLYDENTQNYSISLYIKMTDQK